MSDHSTTKTTEWSIRRALPSLVALGCAIIGLYFEFTMPSEFSSGCGLGLSVGAGAVAVAELMS